MASGKSSLVKGLLVLLFIGAVFAGLSFLLEDAPDQTTVTTANAPTTPTEASQETPAEADAREYGAEIGERVGEEIGRRVGELLVARLDVPTDDSTGSESTQLASSGDMDSEPESTSMTSEDSAESVSAQDVATEPESVPTVEPETVAEAEPEPDMAETDVAEQDAADTPTEEASESAAASESDIDDSPTPQADPEPDPSKAFVFASSGWWNETANDASFHIDHIGKAAAASGFRNSIVVILSEAYMGGQNLENLIQVSTDSGDKVSGLWRRSANGRNLFFHVENSGVYTLAFSADLTSQEGKKLGTALSGTVTIR